MEPIAVTTAVFVLAVVVAAFHQWVLDSPLLELGTESWFPTDGELPAAKALARGALAGAVPLAATIAAAALVLTAPFAVWVWGVVGLLAVTVALSPVLAVHRYDLRPPTPEERAALAALPDLHCEVLVVTDARDGPVNGYAIGGPFRDVVGVSEFALARLPPAQVAALLAHEACHHRQRHVLVRGGVSVAVLACGALVTTTLFDALTPPATLGLVATVAVERVVAYRVMRRLEYRADAVAAEYTSVEAVVGLLTALDDATGVEQASVPRLLGLFSTHPSYAQRVERLRGEATGDEAGRSPVSTVRR